MAHFRAVIQGMRGVASRLGSQNSGIDASVNGWKGGVEVLGRSSGKAGTDEFTINATGGSLRSTFGHGYIGSVIDGAFIPSESVKFRIIEEYKAACLRADHACPHCGVKPSDIGHESPVVKAFREGGVASAVAVIEAGK